MKVALRRRGALSRLLCAVAALALCACEAVTNDSTTIVLPGRDGGMMPPPRDGMMPPPPDGMMPPPPDGMMPPAGDMGPAACVLDNDCANKCGPLAKGCKCTTTPMGNKLCAPTCTIDTDCPVNPMMPLSCNPMGICAPR